MNQSTALLFSSYLPPIQYLTKFLKYEKILIERWEHFPKQTYRNRCCIYSANGKLQLTIPIQHGKDEHQIMKDVKIANDFDWQKIHWKSIETAYRCSPFFEFYEDEFISFYKKKYNYLMDYNEELLKAILKLLMLNISVTHTSSYETDYPENIIDYRSVIHPKKEKEKLDNNFSPIQYSQVFSDRHDFIPNLSIIDLLFNQGPSAIEILKSCIK